jgi:hypothetical protein
MTVSLSEYKPGDVIKILRVDIMGSDKIFYLHNIEVGRTPYVCDNCHGVKNVKETFPELNNFLQRLVGCECEYYG